MRCWMVRYQSFVAALNAHSHILASLRKECATGSLLEALACQRGIF